MIFSTNDGYNVYDLRVHCVCNVSNIPFKYLQSKILILLNWILLRIIKCIFKCVYSHIITNTFRQHTLTMVFKLFTHAPNENILTNTQQNILEMYTKKVLSTLLSGKQNFFKNLFFFFFEYNNCHCGYLKILWNITSKMYSIMNNCLFLGCSETRSTWRMFSTLQFLPDTSF
jgi:hypothetical protein